MPKNNISIWEDRGDQSIHLKVGAEHKWEVDYGQTPWHTSAGSTKSKSGANENCCI